MFYLNSSCCSENKDADPESVVYTFFMQEHYTKGESNLCWSVTVVKAEKVEAKLQVIQTTKEAPSVKWKIKAASSKVLWAPERAVFSTSPWVYFSLLRQAWTFL